MGIRFKFLNSEESRELTQFKSYLGAELSDNITAAQRHFPSFKQNWPISPGASPRSNRDRPPSLRRSKSTGQGTSCPFMTFELESNMLNTGETLDKKEYAMANTECYSSPISSKKKCSLEPIPSIKIIRPSLPLSTQHGNKLNETLIGFSISFL